MERELEELIWRRARDACEFCQMPQAYDDLPFQIDHIIALKHGGPTVEGNLALTCFFCNSFKGPNIAGIDPESGSLVPLFHPRRHRWSQHFRWAGPILEGRTPIGRTTIFVLQPNLPARVALRRTLIAEGRFPPPRTRSK